MILVKAGNQHKNRGQLCFTALQSKRPYDISVFDCKHALIFVILLTCMFKRAGMDDIVVKKVEKRFAKVRFCPVDQ